MASSIAINTTLVAFGRATGGNYGFRVEKSLALAMMVRPEPAAPGTELAMTILDRRHRWR